MNIQQIKSIAKTNGINPGKQSKIPLIRSIQRKEGNFDCFATATTRQCDQGSCLWRLDCFDCGTKPNGKGKISTNSKSKPNGKINAKANGKTKIRASAIAQ